MVDTLTGSYFNTETHHVHDMYQLCASCTSCTRPSFWAKFKRRNMGFMSWEFIKNEFARDWQTTGCGGMMYKYKLTAYFHSHSMFPFLLSPFNLDLSTFPKNAESFTKSHHFQQFASSRKLIPIFFHFFLLSIRECQSVFNHNSFLLKNSFCSCSWRAKRQSLEWLWVCFWECVVFTFCLLTFLLCACTVLFVFATDDYSLVLFKCHWSSLDQPLEL